MALINCLRMHGPNYDDTHLRNIVHAEAAGLPAALAGARQLDAG